MEKEKNLFYVFGFCNHSGIKRLRLQDTAQDYHSSWLVSSEWHTLNVKGREVEKEKQVKEAMQFLTIIVF